MGSSKAYRVKVKPNKTVMSGSAQGQNTQAQLRAKEHAHQDLEHKVTSLKEEAARHKRSVDHLEQELREAKVGPGGHHPPRHQTRFQSLFLELNGIL